ncbi:hypothetical protein [Thermoleptolyngbya sp. C42_A2020_037]|uniref:hypothetical protein n=1 Tax=Thermoleptolyngbya sp. C42_A2020_037 TaxID=2747799 RepID=UPI0019E32D82|nr:hypothetical protein [Thermoleptolyngbya sp. C42_A2020_037]MBF2084607.1 hypothetical protein [Thermoleptolyngbya sp. C42_A2020_037]
MHYPAIAGRLRFGSGLISKRFLVTPTWHNPEVWMRFGFSFACAFTEFTLENSQQFFLSVRFQEVEFCGSVCQFFVWQAAAQKLVIGFQSEFQERVS